MVISVGVGCSARACGWWWWGRKMGVRLARLRIWMGWAGVESRVDVEKGEIVDMGWT